MTRWKRIIFSLVLVAGSILAALGIAEWYLGANAATRQAMPFYNDLAPYVMFKPKATENWESPDTYEMSHHQSKVYDYTNEHGFRVPAFDYELPKAKPPGQLRIVVLGGSAVHHGSRYENALPGALKGVVQQNHPGMDIEVINAGIISCVSRQSIVFLLFTVLEYQPDIVVLYDGANDIGNVQVYESRPNFPYNYQSMEEAWEAYRSQNTSPLWEVVLSRSRVWAALQLRWGGELKTATTVGMGLRREPNARTPEQVLNDPEYVRMAMAAYLSNWTKMIELSKSYGFQPVCVLQAAGGLDREHAGKTMPMPWLDAFGALYGEAGRQIEELRARYPDAAILNLSDYLKPAEDHFWDGIHVYDESNVLLAERIYEDLEISDSGASTD